MSDKTLPHTHTLTLWAHLSYTYIIQPKKRTHTFFFQTATLSTILGKKGLKPTRRERGRDRETERGRETEIERERKRERELCLLYYFIIWGRKIHVKDSNRGREGEQGRVSLRGIKREGCKRRENYILKWRRGGGIL